MRQVLVTGGAGFIGSHLVDRLLAENRWRVTAVDDFNDFYSPDIKRRNVQPQLQDSHYNLIERTFAIKKQSPKSSPTRSLIALCIWQRAPAFVPH